MKLLVRLRDASGGTFDLPLEAGEYRLVAERGFTYELLIERDSGRESDADLKASARRRGNDLVIDVPAAGGGLVLEGFYAAAGLAGEPSVALSSGGAEWARLGPQDPLPVGLIRAIPDVAAPPDASSDSNAGYWLAGAALLGLAGAAAAGGSGGKTSSPPVVSPSPPAPTPPPAPSPPAAPTPAPSPAAKVTQIGLEGSDTVIDAAEVSSGGGVDVIVRTQNATSVVLSINPAGGSASTFDVLTAGPVAADGTFRFTVNAAQMSRGPDGTWVLSASAVGAGSNVATARLEQAFTLRLSSPRLDAQTFRVEGTDAVISGTELSSGGGVTLSGTVWNGTSVSASVLDAGGQSLGLAGVRVAADANGNFVLTIPASQFSSLPDGAFKIALTPLDDANGRSGSGVTRDFTLARTVASATALDDALALEALVSDSPGAPSDAASASLSLATRVAAIAAVPDHGLLLDDLQPRLPHGVA